MTLREMCPNTELFLVRIWTLFTQCESLESYKRNNTNKKLLKYNQLA